MLLFRVSTFLLSSWFHSFCSFLIIGRGWCVGSSWMWFLLFSTTGMDSKTLGLFSLSCRGSSTIIAGVGSIICGLLSMIGGCSFNSSSISSRNWFVIGFARSRMGSRLISKSVKKNYAICKNFREIKGKGKLHLPLFISGVGGGVSSGDDSESEFTWIGDDGVDALPL